MSKNSALKLRFFLLVGFFSLLFLGISYRAFVLAVWDPYRLKHKQTHLIHKKILQRAPRGEFFDRWRYPLAMNVPRYRIYLDLIHARYTVQERHDLAKILAMPAEELGRMIDKNHGKYLTLKQIDHAQKLALQSAGLPGVHWEEMFGRYYPLGFAAGPLVGRVDHSGLGVEGLEQLYESYLAGQDGEQQVRQNRLGQAVKFLKSLKPMELGTSIVLTLDHRVQQYAYRELLAQIESSEAKAGAVVVLNHKGDILAMVSAPSYDPNSKLQAVDHRMANRAVVDVFEPGSTLKPIAFASLLPSLSERTMVDTEGGRYRLGRFLIRDVKDYGVLNLTEVMAHSSNVAMIKLTKQVGGDGLLRTYQKFKLFEPTYAGLLGEQAPVGALAIKPGSIGYYALSYGYGLQVSLLQLAHAYLILSNLGMDPGVHILDESMRVRTEPVRVVPASVVSRLIPMMVAAVEMGTGKLARLEGVSIAGKTGTSQRAVSGKYTESKHITTFVGFGPAHADAPLDERYVVAVVIFEPKVGKHFAGLSAAPLFAKIMHYVLSLHQAQGRGVYGEKNVAKWDEAQ